MPRTSVRRSLTWVLAKYTSTLSLNTAVNWAKPLREKERMLSSPGVPASARSSSTVTCFSISTGVSAGAMALICTWLLVTSGTASMGKRASDHAPKAVAMRVTRMTA